MGGRDEAMVPENLSGELSKMPTGRHCLTNAPPLIQCRPLSSSASSCVPLRGTYSTPEPYVANLADVSGEPVPSKPLVDNLIGPTPSPFRHNRDPQDYGVHNGADDVADSISVPTGINIPAGVNEGHDSDSPPPKPELKALFSVVLPIIGVVLAVVGGVMAFSMRHRGFLRGLSSPSKSSITVVHLVGLSQVPRGPSPSLPALGGISIAQPRPIFSPASAPTFPVTCKPAANISPLDSLMFSSITPSHDLSVFPVRFQTPVPEAIVSASSILSAADALSVKTDKYPEPGPPALERRLSSSSTSSITSTASSAISNRDRKGPRPYPHPALRPRSRNIPTPILKPTASSRRTVSYTVRWTEKDIFIPSRRSSVDSRRTHSSSGSISSISSCDSACDQPALPSANCEIPTLAFAPTPLPWLPSPTPRRPQTPPPLPRLDPAPPPLIPISAAPPRRAAHSRSRSIRLDVSHLAAIVTDAEPQQPWLHQDWPAKKPALVMGVYPDRLGAGWKLEKGPDRGC
ncbi:hypothetical protein BDK51DRAFT_46516 [Blyttiomyces helicus]|uniref:Uncharacterized protein n=1 Tax=Blyttiomyces helicus TaxID=388810 RepID=A0A4P9VZU9_9FUNG|nr:hypothetical protein BDK51DRAFT_46516 [Blyttiomyces helicus]|eukprot:RKO84333.1 hypothetical protein BDK51DRAFT_46516 [Blyttiomyces helicus]